MASFFDFTVKDAQGKDFPLEQLKGKTVLVVNVASRCGFTSQYTGLESLYQQFKDRDFVILGFPCNQFGAQEPGTNEEIQSTCTRDWGVTFPVLAKVDVNGPSAAPVFDFLKASSPGLLGTEFIKWNFTKFLVDRNGRVIERFAPRTEPQELLGPISRLLG